MITVLTSEILHCYTEKKDTSTHFIVGLDGLSGAGKSTITHDLEIFFAAKNISICVIHMDNHITRADERYNTGFESWYEYYQLQWDIAMLQEKLFQPLKCGNTNIHLPFYNKENDSLTEQSFFLEKNTICIIEGIFLQRKEWRSFFNFVIYLDCSRQTRYERVLKRDTYIGSMEDRMKKYEERYWKGEDHYLCTEKPVEIADYVCRN